VLSDIGTRADVSIVNETEFSMFNREAYEAFKLNPEVCLFLFLFQGVMFGEEDEKKADTVRLNGHDAPFTCQQHIIRNNSLMV